MERINVSVRARPLSPEDAKTSPWCISGNSIFIPNQPSKFEFDRIFREETKTLQVYESRTKDIVAAAVRGFNGTVFAYGQTNSGKTHTMRGSTTEPGGFLHIDEYPPDANQGFDIPSAIVSFPDFRARMHFLAGNSLTKSPMISKLQEPRRIQSYTEVLLVPLTTPDFSMPYNVITITCTVFALYFGSLLNALRRRVAEEERRQKEKAAEKTGRFLLLSKLFAKLRGRSWEPPPPSASSTSILNSKLIMKVIVVAVIAAGWQFYFG